jgi:undecaprenyl-diphosphatase
MYSFSILFISSIVTWIVSESIKNIIRIERPITEGLIVNESGFSFPSSHASVTMVLGVVVYSIDKKLGLILITASLFVGLSRVILGVHYVADVIVGWLLGLLIGFIFIKIFKNL